MSLLLLPAELVLLYFLSRRVVQTIYLLILRVTRLRSVAISLVTIIFFPGTVVHELAHLFVAEILRVRTGKLTLVPESLEGSEIKAGGVLIAETDPLRRTLIGLAPVYVGIAVLAGLSWWMTRVIPDESHWSYWADGSNWGRLESYLPLLIAYALFAVSNSMFSSKEDMKGVIPFTITVGLFAGAAYMAGFRIGLTSELLENMLIVLQTLVRSLGMVIGVNLVVLAATSALMAVLRKATP